MAYLPDIEKRLQSHAYKEALILQRRYREARCKLTSVLVGNFTLGELVFLMDTKANTDVMELFYTPERIRVIEKIVKRLSI